MEISDRKKAILQAIVDAYIETAEPVGSKFLATRSGISLSAATLRNEMAELKEWGLLEQPHTSAGSIPSQFGFRTYVDSLMNSYRLSLEEMQKMNHLMQRRISELERFLVQTSKVISELTGCATIASTPLSEGTTIRRIDLLPIDHNTFVLVMVLRSGVIKNKICHVDEGLEEDVLTHFSHLLNEKIAGLPVELITLPAMMELEREMGEYRYLVAPVLSAIGEAASELPETEVIVGGEERLFDYPEFHDVAAAKDMFSFLQDKHELKKMIEPAIFEPGITIHIGEENQPIQMKNSSLILGNYRIGGRVVGAVGIIGPMRMDYKKMVSHLEYFTQKLTELFEETFEDTSGPPAPR